MITTFLRAGMYYHFHIFRDDYAHEKYFSFDISSMRRHISRSRLFRETFLHFDYDCFGWCGVDYWWKHSSMTFHLSVTENITVISHHHFEEIYITFLAFSMMRNTRDVRNIDETLRVAIISSTTRETRTFSDYADYHYRHHEPRARKHRWRRWRRRCRAIERLHEALMNMQNIDYRH